MWCKTEGNGLRNDWTRAYADLTLRTALARRLGSDVDSLRERIPILVSGGSEGVVSPHLVVITGSPAGAPAGAPDRIGLVAGIAGGAIPQDAVGTARHGRLAADLVRAAMAQAGLTAGRYAARVRARAVGSGAGRLGYQGARRGRAGRGGGAGRGRRHGP